MNMNLIQMEKFRDSERGALKIRMEILPSGKAIAFGIAKTALTIVESDNENIDFDKESDVLIKQHESSNSNHTFEYVPTSGFTEVNTDEQDWFNFN